MNIAAWDSATTVSEKNIELPTDFELNQNYPIPFNPDTYINYQLPEASHVIIIIYNMLGQEVRTPVNEHQLAGYYTVQWDGRDVRGIPVVSGIYLYQIRAGNFNCKKKMTLLI